jgi:hypothetical protein
MCTILSNKKKSIIVGLERKEESESQKIMTKNLMQINGKTGIKISLIIKFERKNILTFIVNILKFIFNHFCYFFLC